MSFVPLLSAALSSFSGSSSGGAQTLGTYWHCYPLLVVGAVPASATLDVEIEESADGSSWATIPGSKFPTVYDDGSNKIHYGLILNNPPRKPLVRFKMIAAGGNVPAVGLFLLDRHDDVGISVEWRVDQ